ncbi:MAG: hypothetical protein M9904_18730 [Chitinophagaceae bacterium]|jgi:hypothetical protein|nr:hypothetical protein [Chitinophagaceae bacterium]
MIAVKICFILLSFYPVVLLYVQSQASPISSSCTISVNVKLFFSKIFVEALCSGAVLAVIVTFGFGCGAVGTVAANDQVLPMVGK